MLRRFLIFIPVGLLFTATGVVVLASHAPQTWSVHWSPPTTVLTGTSTGEFGAVPAGSRRWDILRYDAGNQDLVYDRAGHHTGGELVLDRGDSEQPALARVGSVEVGAWIHNYNGGTNLYSAIFRRGSRPHVTRVVHGTAPVEHPFVFAGPDGQADIVFSWQRSGNFDVYLARLATRRGTLSWIHRLTSVPRYDFYPRVAIDGKRQIVMVNLESCCSTRGWNVFLSRFSAAGFRLGAPVLLATISAADVNQWGEDIRADASGDVWGAVAGGTGAYLFRTDRSGRVVRGPTEVDLPGPVSPALALVPAGSHAYLVWQQAYSLGAYIESGVIDDRLQLRQLERVEYLSGIQNDPHAALSHGKIVAVWENQTSGSQVGFVTTSRRSASNPTLSQRLGLGIGNPWAEFVLLIVGALGVATVAATANILVIFVFIGLGLIVLRVLRRVPGRWLLYTCFLTGVLFVTFVVPGEPTLFLVTVPSIGFSTVPYGILGALSVLALMLWLGNTLLRRIDDVFRAGVMAVVGVYFFAFVESVVFVQHQLGFI